MSAKRGPYRKCYLVPHRTGFKYCRAVPKDLQPLEKKQAWVKYLGPVSRAVAETMAHALAYEHGRRILALRGEKFKFDPGSNGVTADPALLVRASTIAPSMTRDVDEALTLMDLVLLWERVRAPRSAIGRSKTRLCARRFVDLIGNPSVQEIRRAHAVAYRDALESTAGMRPKNVGDHLSRLHVLFTVAMSEGVLEANPFHNVRPRCTGAFASRRQGFAPEHVQAIFAALNQETQAFSWIVRLLAFHGMCSGEVCQLRCEDVTVLHGVPVLRIHDLHGSVKNRASIRDVPLHPACMAIQAQASRAVSEGDGWLFPFLPVKSPVEDGGFKITAVASDVRKSAYPIRRLRRAKTAVWGERGELNLALCQKTHSCWSRFFQLGFENLPGFTTATCVTSGFCCKKCWRFSSVLAARE